ncbi:Monoamine oxidase [Pseudomonas syringae pv. actinidiae]|uniref:Monoamine oxidase n=1 Tax=Pseudomonas syringae pv. actinidiae TaxID=103796 RepID=A0A2V0QKB0_PSESF|nr:Monoamine oxidase [Pseudomonas syringae pv. actinidiae]
MKHLGTAIGEHGAYKPLGNHAVFTAGEASALESVGTAIAEACPIAFNYRAAARSFVSFTNPSDDLHAWP